MVDLEFEDDVATITVDRPHACNSIALDTMEQLEKVLDGAEGARASVITGAGDKAFIAGGDLKSLASVRTEVEASAMAWRMRSIYDRIAAFPCPCRRRSQRPHDGRRCGVGHFCRYSDCRGRHQDWLQSGQARNHAGVGRIVNDSRHCVGPSRAFAHRRHGPDTRRDRGRDASAHRSDRAARHSKRHGVRSPVR